MLMEMYYLNLNQSILFNTLVVNNYSKSIISVQKLPNLFPSSDPGPIGFSTWRVRKHRIVGEISYIRIIDQAKLIH